METAGGLHRIGVTVFRAGIWKPRTHPGCFEGHGAPALDWLRQVKENLGMKVTCEVAGSEHVEACLRGGVDMVWIGARTTANPFLVQEIAEALSGTDVPVLVKNPINPDVNLWVGAFERLAACGIRRMAAVHRGVSTFSKLKYRNDPAWDMAIELRSRFPEMTLFCDPSHMGGSREFIRELSQRALDLGFEGLMIESHCNPSCALSDSDQQIVPDVLGDLLAGSDALRTRQSDTDDKDYRENIRRLRSEIDILDEDLLTILGRRMDVSRRIGLVKKDNNVAILQPVRWDGEISRMVDLGRKAGLSEEFIRDVFSSIHEESVNVQNRIQED